jgi:uncharacterized protein (TIGR00369 family)
MADERIERLMADLARVAAPWVRELGLQVEQADDERVQLSMPVAAALVHGGGVLCGQAIMAAADTAMVLAVSSALGGFRPMTTVQLQTSFLRPVPGDAGTLTITCRILRKGKSLVFGEVECAGPDGRLAAHATTTYALL